MMTTAEPPRAEDMPVTAATDRPLVTDAGHLAAADPLDAVRAVAACLPNDADDVSDAGQPTTDHPAEGWRGEPLAKP